MDSIFATFWTLYGASVKLSKVPKMPIKTVYPAMAGFANGGSSLVYRRLFLAYRGICGNHGSSVN